MRRVLIGVCMTAGLLMTSPVVYSQVLVGDPINTDRVPFDDVSSGSVDFFDVDGDGDQDVLITGYNNNDESVARLYENTSNDGVISFTEVIGLPLQGVRGSIAISDVDGDGDEDILIVGQDGSNQLIAELYENTTEGEISFSKFSGLPLEGVFLGAVAFSDVDGDGDDDLLIIGSTNFERISKLYENTTTGGIISFSEVSGLGMEGVRGGSVAFSDVDGDGDQDVVISGIDSSYDRTITLYENTTVGGIISFSIVDGLTLDEVDLSSLAFADVDNDGDEDLLIAGLSDYGRISKLYENTSTAMGISFSEVSGLSLDEAISGSVAFSDTDGDGDEDLLITGFSNDQRIAKFYENTTTGSGINFTEVSELSFEEGINTSIAFADVDDDGDEDVLITGFDNGYDGFSKLYKNTTTSGAISFSEDTGLTLEGVRSGSFAFSDVDRDGVEELLITGFGSSNQHISKLYKNTTSGDIIDFSEVMGLSLEGVQGSSIAFSDIDGDGDDDLLIAGFSNSDESISNLYENTTNEGAINFEEVSGMFFDGVTTASVAFSDVDGDGDEDVLITGYSTINKRISKLYENTTTGGTISFSEVDGLSLEGVSTGSVVFSDVDSDGDEDLLISGCNNSYQGTSRLYENTTTGDIISFSEVNGLSLEGVQNSSVAFSDVDGDGDDDILITGKGDGGLLVIQIHENTSNSGTISFSVVNDLSLMAVEFGSVDFSDIDGDGDNDFLITGRNAGNPNGIAKLYENTTTSGVISFSEVEGLSIEGVRSSSVAFFDVDRDGDDDVLITGTNGSQQLSNLYINTTKIPDIIEPFFTSVSSVSVNENIAITETVYTAIATDVGVVTYSLYGTDASDFNLNATTGVLTFMSSPDFETKSSYEVTITATDTAGNSSDLDITITVNDLEEIPPVFTSGISATVNENIAISEIVYTALATDEGSITYSLSGTDAESFDLNETSGVLTFKVSPDFETKNSYELTITATDDSGNSADQAVTIIVNDLDEDSPVFTSESSLSVNENIAITEVIYMALATDASSVTYSLGGTDADSFDLDASSGVLTFKSSPDFETQSSYNVTITAMDNVGNSTDLELTITINDLDESPPLSISKEHNIIIYPNPVASHLHLSVENQIIVDKIRILSPDGKGLMEFAPSRDHIYDLSELANGTYIIVFSTGEEKEFLYRVIKND